MLASPHHHQPSPRSTPPSDLYDKMSKDLPKTSHRGYDSHYSLRYTGSQRDRFGIDKKLAIRSMLDGNEGEDYPENFTGEWYVPAGLSG